MNVSKPAHDDEQRSETVICTECGNSSMISFISWLHTDDVCVCNIMCMLWECLGLTSKVQSADVFHLKTAYAQI